MKKRSSQPAKEPTTEQAKIASVEIEALAHNIDRKSVV
jgi:hypothetical protein